MLATFTVSTGYFQDRLLPSVTFVYDFRSNSGAVLPEVTYRFTENFSASFGLAGFFGRYEKKEAPLFSSAPTRATWRTVSRRFGSATRPTCASATRSSAQRGVAERSSRGGLSGVAPASIVRGFWRSR
jgi:hypothetical protein